MTTVKSPRTPARLAVLPLVLALGACAFAPDRKPPAAPQPAQYGVQPLPAAGAAAQGVAQRYEQGAQPVPQWWKRYGSPELDALVEEGLAKTRTWPPPAARWLPPASSCAARSIHP